MTTDDVVAHYMERVRQHMEGMTPAERVEFVTNRRLSIIAASERFNDRIDSGQWPGLAESAWDYTIAIAELGAMLDDEKRRAGL